MPPGFVMLDDVAQLGGRCDAARTEAALLFGRINPLAFRLVGVGMLVAISITFQPQYIVPLYLLRTVCAEPDRAAEVCPQRLRCRSIAPSGMRSTRSTPPRGGQQCQGLLADRMGYRRLPHHSRYGRPAACSTCR